MNKPIVAMNLINFLVAASGMSAELFRYRGAAKDGRKAQYVFESDEKNDCKSVTKEQVTEIAGDFMTSFYRIELRDLETQEFRQQPIPFWLVSFPASYEGTPRKIFFVVVSPNGTVVQPRVEKRL